jgi:hypothetical protein
VLALNFEIIESRADKKNSFALDFYGGTLGL